MSFHQNADSAGGPVECARQRKKGGQLYMIGKILQTCATSVYQRNIGVRRSLQSWVSTIQSVVLTANVFRFLFNTLSSFSKFLSVKLTKDNGGRYTWYAACKDDYRPQIYRTHSWLTYQNISTIRISHYHMYVVANLSLKTPTMFNTQTSSYPYHIRAYNQHVLLYEHSHISTFYQRKHVEPLYLPPRHTSWWQMHIYCNNSIKGMPYLWPRVSATAILTTAKH